MSKLGGIGILWLYVLLVFSAVVLGLSASIVAQDHDSGIAIAHLVISTLGFTIPFLSCCLVFNQADDEAGAVGVAIGFLSLFAYTGLVIGLSKDPVASDRIFHNTEHGDDALTANPYYGLFVVDLIIIVKCFLFTVVTGLAASSD